MGPIEFTFTIPFTCFILGYLEPTIGLPFTSFILGYLEPTLGLPFTIFILGYLEPTLGLLLVLFQDIWNLLLDFYQFYSRILGTYSWTSPPPSTRTQRIMTKREPGPFSSTTSSNMPNRLCEANSRPDRPFCDV